jgi:hypothetical protein
MEENKKIEKPIKFIKKRFNGFLRLNNVRDCHLEVRSKQRFFQNSFNLKKNIFLDEDIEYFSLHFYDKNEYNLIIDVYSEQDESDQNLYIRVSVMSDNHLKLDYLDELEKRILDDKSFENLTINQITHTNSSGYVFFLTAKKTIDIQKQIFLIKTNTFLSENINYQKDLDFLYQHFRDKINNSSKEELERLKEIITLRMGELTKESKELIELNYIK